MAEYTMQVQYSTDGWKTWAPVDDSFPIESSSTLARLADPVEGHFDEPEALPPGSTWRMAMWNGYDADTSTWPDAAWDGEVVEDLTAEQMLEELFEIRARRAADADRRDVLVRRLMRSEERVPREQIQEAAGVSRARLYQIAKDV